MSIDRPAIRRILDQPVMNVSTSFAAQGVRVGYNHPRRWSLWMVRVLTARTRAFAQSQVLRFSALCGGLLAILMAIIHFGLLEDGLPGLLHRPVTPPTATLNGKTDGQIEQAQSLEVRKLNTERVAPLSDTVATRRSTVMIRPPFEIADARTFGSPDMSVMLVNATGPERDAVCFNATGNLWACGLAARAALNNLLRTTTLTCDTVDSASRPVEGICRLPDGQDLSGVMVAAGFLRPANPEEFKAEEALARTNQRGLWNGGWSIRSLTAAPPSAPLTRLLSSAIILDSKAFR